MTVEQLISPDYRAEQQRLHADPRGYGQKGRKWAETVIELAAEFNCQTLLDYGAGQGSLAESLRAQGFVNLAEYDPAIAGKDTLPSPADLVVCTDCLEHVESERIWFVLKHLRQLTQCVCFVVVSLVETAKVLSDGRQAHILLRSTEWWRFQMRSHDFVIWRELDIKPDKQWVAVLTK